jgi:predicted naringenin-chalcone synthase
MNTQGPKLLSVSVANPGQSYTQEEVFDILDVKDLKIKRIFTNSHIKTRNLCFSEADNGNTIEEENSLDLWNKHKKYAIETGEKAIREALKSINLEAKDIDYIACVTSTGFLCPGLSAHLIKRIGFRQNIHRIDIVGMGCNAGLNGMQPVVNYCKQNPGKYGLLVCSEVCSAAYVKDETISKSVVNSLFGDGSVAAIFSDNQDSNDIVGAQILGFESYIIPDHIDAMRFDYNGDKYAFYLDKQIPYVLGNNIEKPVKTLLDRYNLKIRDIDHWILHSGGKKVIDSIKYNLNITEHDVRHTKKVLENFGNLSSCAFLFSSKNLIDEKIAKEGENIFIITMGPGTTIECCIGKF